MKHYVRALGFIRPYKWFLVSAVVLALLASVFEMAGISTVVPLMKALTDPQGLSGSLSAVAGKLSFLSRPIAGFQRLLLTRLSLALLTVGCIAAAATCLKAAFDFLNGFIVEYVAERATLDMRAALYTKVICLPLRFFTSSSLGAILSRFTNDLSSLARGFNLSFGRFVREPIMLAVTVGSALWLDWTLSHLRLTPIVLVAAPLVAWAVTRLARRIRKSTRRALERRADIMQLLEDTISGIKIVKVSQAERSESGRLDSIQKRLLREVAKVVAADNALGPVVDVVAAASSVALLVAAVALLDLPSAVKEGLFLFLLIAYYKAYVSAKKLISSLGAFQVSDAAAGRMFEVVDMPPEPGDVPGARELQPLNREIRFESVSFSYNGGRKVIDGVSFSAAKGEVVAIVGSSGAGKTSLVNLIPRFYLPTGGRVTIDGVDIRDAKISSLRKQIGIVTQETILFDDTICNNIAYGLSRCPLERVIEAAKLANAHDFISKLPQQYQTRLSGGLQTLSGGEQQRIALARAVVRDPAILILDEATSALDAESEALIQEALAEIVKHRVTFIIAHRPSTIMLADKIVVLHKGKVESAGSHDELIRTSPVYRSLYARGFADEDIPAEKANG